MPLIQTDDSPNHMSKLPIFNRHPIITPHTIYGGNTCLVIDNALENPECLVAFAAHNQDLFDHDPGNAYPGNEFKAPEEITGRFRDFFMQHIKSRMGARRLQELRCRFSIASWPPSALFPHQWICHHDTHGLPKEDLTVAAVLYLFKNENFGGTSFYRLKKSEAELRSFQDHGRKLNKKDWNTFSQKNGIPQGYMTESNDYFELCATIPAQWNRIIFYDGSLYHSGDIRHPELLTEDAATGRLTINGFFRCTRSLQAG